MNKTCPSQFEIIAKACRHDSGKSMCDSGDYYGRHYDRPTPQEKALETTIEAFCMEGRDPDITATIITAHWLNKGFTLDEEIQEQFNEWEKDKHGTWFALSTRFCEEVLGHHRHVRDNVYNNENDFDQKFVWEVWTPKEEESDWVYADDSLCVIFVHTGCDVRGGYSFPLFLRSNSYDYSMQIDWCAQFYAEEGTDSEGNPLSYDELHKLDESWQCGYSSHPSSTFSDDVSSLLEEGPDWVRVVLKSGETVKVCSSLPWLE